MYMNQHRSRIGVKRAPYSSVTSELREMLIQKVENEGLTIKQASSSLAINYSTAKTIISIYRKSGRTARLSNPRNVQVSNPYDHGHTTMMQGTSYFGDNILGNENCYSNYQEMQQMNFQSPNRIEEVSLNYIKKMEERFQNNISPFTNQIYTP